MKTLVGCVGNLMVLIISGCFGVMFMAVATCMGLQFIVSSLL